MAKVSGPCHSSEARGLVGSLVYNTWRGVNYVKGSATPEIEYSEAHVALRDLTALVTASWQGLTDVQRAAWGDYADDHRERSCLGELIRLTGYNWYVRINVRRLLVDEGIEEAPPTLVLMHRISGLTIYVGAGHLHPRWTHVVACTPATLYYEFWRCGPHSAGMMPTVRQCRRVGFTTYASGEFFDASDGPGLYTYFVRPEHSTGLVAGWDTAKGTATA